jgi:molecular chaperone HscB
MADSSYFELFGLPVVFDIDVADLSVRYRELARTLHPDRFARGSDEERRLAAQRMAILNEGFQVLKQPITRAQYVLRLRNGASEQVPGDVVFLTQQMELRERLDDVRSDREGLNALRSEIKQSLQERERVLAAQLSTDSWKPDAARQTVTEMQFFDKLLRQIDDLQEQFI